MTNPGKRRSAATVVLVLFFLLLVGACSGMTPPPAPADTVAEHEWKEDALSLPAFPQDADLLPMTLSKAVPARILIDGKSISVGKDGVVRYTVAVEGSGGVRNVFFEGIRCDTGEFKQFAYGTAEQTFAPFQSPEWEKIRNFGLGAFRYEAYRQYFCDIGRVTRKPAEIVREIRYPQTVNE
jgi:hypothetical protein